MSVLTLDDMQTMKHSECYLLRRNIFWMVFDMNLGRLKLQAVLFTCIQQVKWTMSHVIEELHLDFGVEHPAAPTAEGLILTSELSWDQSAVMQWLHCGSQIANIVKGRRPVGVAFLCTKKIRLLSGLIVKSLFISSKSFYKSLQSWGLKGF